MADIFEQIRGQCAWVAGQATHVHLVEERIPSLAAHLATAAVAPPEIDRIHHYVEPEADPAGTAAVFVTLDAVNFGSGYFPLLRKGQGLSGYFTIASALTERFRSSGALTAVELAEFTPKACAEIFEQDLRVPEIAELMSLFSEAWNSLGEDLLERFGGDFATLLEAADGSASRLVGLLDRQPFFHDVADYHGVEVPIYKRAQIVASDLALALDGQGLGRFEDLDRLTIFADNLVPHVLRVEGLLAYDRSLLARIEQGHLIESGSEEEIEIRACAVHAVEQIAESLRSMGCATTSRNLDLLLWNRGQNPRIKGAGPRHRTRCVYY